MTLKGGGVGDVARTRRGGVMFAAEQLGNLSRASCLDTRGGPEEPVTREVNSRLRLGTKFNLFRFGVSQ